MDGAHFNRMTRNIVAIIRQTAFQRLGALPLVGVPMLRHAAEPARADDRLRKRKRRGNDNNNGKNKDKNTTGSSIFKRGISHVIDNTSGAHTITVESGEVIHQTRCCNGLAAFTIPAGETRLFDTSSDQAYAWIDNRYWIEFFNPFIGLPWVTAAVDGMADGQPRCCKPGGTTVVDERTLEEGGNLGFALGVQEFTIHRNDDKPDFKFFNLKVG